MALTLLVHVENGISAGNPRGHGVSSGGLVSDVWVEGGIPKINRMMGVSVGRIRLLPSHV